jgi:hypothetical protein
MNIFLLGVRRIRQTIFATIAMENAMKITQQLATKLLSIISLMVLHAFLGADAYAADVRVTVTNTPKVIIGNVKTNPIPVSFQQTPYQEQRDIPDARSCAPQCVVYFSPVPAGQRLVITQISAQVGAGVSTLVMEGPSATLFIPKPFPSSDYINSAVTFNYAAGQTPSARMFIPASSGESLIVTLVGYFVPTS